MQHFAPFAAPASSSVDPLVVRYGGGEFASYIDADSAAPFMTGLRAALESPLHDTQVLNTAIALSNVVALVALSLAQSEPEASELVRGPIRRSAERAFPELAPADDPILVDGACAFICRVFGDVDKSELPDEVDGKTLAAIAALGDAAMLLADQVGLPRPVLSAAVGQAAAQM